MTVHRDRRVLVSGAIRMATALSVILAALRVEAQERGAMTMESLTTVPLGTLSDQFERGFDIAQLRGRSVVVLVADKEGADGQRLWLSSLRASLPTSATVIATADLVGAPRLLRGVIRKGFPKDTSARILMDWDGRVARRLRGERDHLVAVVFGPDGAPRDRVVLPTTSVTAEVRNRLASAVLR